MSRSLHLYKYHAAMKQTLAMLAAVFGLAAQAQMTPVGLWHTIDDETHQPKGEVACT